MLVFPCVVTALSSYAVKPPPPTTAASHLAPTDDTNITRSRARVAEIAYPSLFAAFNNATAEGAAPFRIMAQEMETAPASPIVGTGSPFGAFGALEGGMTALDSIAKMAADKFKPDEMLKETTDQLQHLPASVKDELHKSVMGVVDGLPPQLRDFMHERLVSASAAGCPRPMQPPPRTLPGVHHLVSPCAQGRLAKAVPMELKDELQKDPIVLLKKPDELAAKMSEAQQADAGAAVQDMLMGALQFVITQPQQAAEKLSELVASLPKPLTDIVANANSKLQHQAEEVVSGLPADAVGQVQQMLYAVAPMAQQMMGGGMGGMGGMGGVGAWGQQGYQYPGHDGMLTAGYGGLMVGMQQAGIGMGHQAAAAAAAAVGAGAGASGQHLSSQQQYNQQLQAMQYYYMQQMQYMQAQMNYLQQLQAQNNLGGGGGGHAAAAAAAGAAAGVQHQHQHQHHQHQHQHQPQQPLAAANPYAAYGFGASPL